MGVARIGGSEAAHEDVMMLVELNAAGLFGERVGYVVGGTNVAEDYLFVFDPLEDSELL